jgi:hypothetical protein
MPHDVESRIHEVWKLLNRKPRKRLGFFESVEALVRDHPNDERVVVLKKAAGFLEALGPPPAQEGRLLPKQKEILSSLCLSVLDSPERRFSASEKREIAENFERLARRPVSVDTVAAYIQRIRKEKYPQTYY